jgi:hypothetical protein
MPHASTGWPFMELAARDARTVTSIGNTMAAMATQRRQPK